MSGPPSPSSSPPPSTTSPNQSPRSTSPPHQPTMSDDDNPQDNSPSPSPSPSPPPQRAKTSPSPSPPLQPPVSLPLPPPPALAKTPVFPAREDCWSEPATHTLIEAWGSHYIELNRGNLRQKHWQEVADAVNALHAHTKKLQRTDIQCKNRIDTLKKKYKVEKNKVLESNGRYVSTWPFFQSLDSLIGDTFKHTSPAPPPIKTQNTTAHLIKTPDFTTQLRRTPDFGRRATVALPPPPSAVPVGPRSKRPPPASVTASGHGLGADEFGYRRSFSAMAAAAAAMEEDGEEDESETSSAAGAGGRRMDAVGEGAVGEGYKRLAEAIKRFAEIYERVEEAKQRQMVELEKQRMQFAKDLEIQRMKLFMDSQVQLEKLKRVKRNSRAGE